MSFVPGTALEPIDLFIWIVIGLVVRFLARVIVRGGYGMVGDIVMALVGAFVGGFLTTLLGFGGSAKLIISIIIAFISACVLVAISRFFAGGFIHRARF